MKKRMKKRIGNRIWREISARGRHTEHTLLKSVKSNKTCNGGGGGGAKRLFYRKKTKNVLLIIIGKGGKKRKIIEMTTR